MGEDGRKGWTKRKKKEEGGTEKGVQRGGQVELVTANGGAVYDPRKPAPA